MKPLHAIAAGRLVAGAATLANPTLTGSLLGIGGAPGSHLAARMFGAREVALGLSTLTLSGEALSGVMLAGIVTDLGDILAAVLGARQGSTATPQAAALGTLALGAVAVGVQARRG